MQAAERQCGARRSCHVEGKGHPHVVVFSYHKGYTHKKEDAARNMELTRRADLETTIKRFEKRLEISRFAVEWLYKLVEEREGKETATEKAAVQFSVVELLNQLKASPQSLFGRMEDLQLEDVEEALLYLSKIGALKLEGGFLVLYNAMDIKRIKDNKSRYKQEDYRMLNEFYKQKIQQVHIVGEYANLMVKDYQEALQYVQDYFQMDYRKFIAKYFKGERVNEIQRNLTPESTSSCSGSCLIGRWRLFRTRSRAALWWRLVRAAEKPVCWYTSWPHCCCWRM